MGAFKRCSLETRRLPSQCMAGRVCSSSHPTSRTLLLDHPYITQPQVVAVYVSALPAGHTHHLQHVALLLGADYPAATGLWDTRHVAEAHGAFLALLLCVCVVAAQRRLPRSIPGQMSLSTTPPSAGAAELHVMRLTGHRYKLFTVEQQRSLPGSCHSLRGLEMLGNRQAHGPRQPRPGMRQTC